MKKQFLSFLAAIALSVTCSGISMAQATSGDLVGTVKDASGALLPNATVIVKAESTGVTQTVTAGTSGEFRASNLLPDKYDLTASAAGFQSSTLRGVLVELNKTSTADVNLSVGTSSTTVEVSADAGVVLDTTSTNLTTTFSQQELAALPSASIGLGVLNASLLSPGVASTGGVGIGSGPSVGGQRPRNNNFTIEGIDNNDKAVTGPLIYLPNDAVGSFTLITNQFSPEFGHSSGGQFNSNVVSGTNSFHGRVYEYFQNRNLNAASGVAGGKIPNPRYDNNRYGGEIGGPIFHDKLFFFANYERQSIGQSGSYYLCTPTTAGLATIGALSGGTISTTNVQQYVKYVPAANYNGGAQVTADNDNACGNQATGLQTLSVTNGAGTAVDIPLGNYLVNAPNFSNFDVLTTSVDYNLSAKDSLRGRYVYNKLASADTSAQLPIFFSSIPNKYHLIALSEYHTFTPNLTNELRVGFNRHENTIGAGNFTYPGLDLFPNLTFDDQGVINVGPDGNAPQFTIQNLYQATDNISYVKGKHTIKIGFDGRKYISPQQFTQRARGDYDYSALDEFLHDVAPTDYGERSTGTSTYYGDQTALYGYGNDTWRISPTVTLNYGLRYEFTSVPVGERQQSLNTLASVPGLIDFHAPRPTYKNFAPRVGINWAPDSKTSIRAGFGIGYDVLFDNLGTLSFPPQLSQTEDVDTAGQPAAGSASFLAKGGLLPGSGAVQFCVTGTGGTTGVACVPDLVKQRAKTSAFLPDQVTPYGESYTLTIQRTIGSTFTAEIGYVGTRGIHLPTQDQINIQPRVTTANQLPTLAYGPTVIFAPAGAQTLGKLNVPNGNIVPAYLAAGFTGKITSYQPFSGSNYNGLVTNLTRRFQKGLQMNLSYTYSKTMDNATAEVFATSLTPRRPKNSQNVSGDYSRSALDRTHRASLEMLYDLPYFKHSSNFFKKNLIGNWEISPIYTYESPEYATVLSGVNSNLNGDNGIYIGGALVNPTGAKNGRSSAVHAQYAANLVTLCTPPLTQCSANLVGYIENDPNAQYIQAGLGTSPNTSRNSLPTRPIDNLTVAAFKRFTLFEHYSFEFGAQSFNVLNHAQYIPGSIDDVGSVSNTSTTPFQTTGNAFFGRPDKIFNNQARSVQLSGKFSF